MLMLINACLERVLTRPSVVSNGDSKVLNRKEEPLVISNLLREVSIL